MALFSDLRSWTSIQSLIWLVCDKNAHKVLDGSRMRIWSQSSQFGEKDPQGRSACRSWSGSKETKIKLISDILATFNLILKEEFKRRIARSKEKRDSILAVHHAAKIFILLLLKSIILWKSPKYYFARAETELRTHFILKVDLRIYCFNWIPWFPQHNHALITRVAFNIKK